MVDDNLLNDDYFLKYFLIGGITGKSKIRERYTTGIFSSKHELTIGVEFGLKNVIINDKVYRIQIWDTCGHESFLSIRPPYYKLASCILIVYDITSRESFNNLDSFIEEYKKYSPKKAYTVLVGNKVDL